MVVGIVFSILAIKHRTGKCPPILSINPKDWKPLWMAKDWFSPIGFRLYVIGNMLIIIGVGLILVYFYVR